MSAPSDPLPNSASPSPRLTTRAVMAELADELFSLDRGLPHTLLSLLRSPGGTARRYIEHRDPRLTRPFRLALLMLAVGALLLHFSGAGLEFQSGLREGARGGSGDDELSQGVGLLFARFDITLVLCWVPAVALAFRASFRDPRPNLAEGVAFSLYLLAGLLPIQLALFLLLPWLGLQAPAWMLTAAMLCLLWLLWAGFGYAKPAQRRVLAAASLLGLSLLLLLLLFLILVCASVLLSVLGLLPS